MEKFKLYFLNNKRLFIIVGCILAIGLSLIGCYFYYQHMNRDNAIFNISSNNFENDFIGDENTDTNNNDTTDDNEVNENNEENKVDVKVDNPKNDVIDNKEVVEYIYVDIKGYVNKPGVYKVVKDSNKRISDLISLAGGLKKDANTSVINLSTKLKDEMVVIIYSNKQIEDFIKTKEELKEKIEICDKEEVRNDGCITEDDIDNKFESNDKQDTSDKNGSNTNNNSSDNNETTSDKVNINTASLEELMTLSGIGESKARAIINYRNEVGLFENIEDIKNVSGIGDSAFEKIKDSITIK